MAMNEINLLLDLFPEIVHNDIFPELTAHELLNLLQINNDNLQNIVLEYIRKMKTIKFFRNVDEVIKEDLSIHQVTLEQIGIFHHNCRNLRVLDLRGCHSLTDAHLLPFVWENRETLETVHLDGCFMLSHPGLIHLDMCENLSYLAYNHIRFESECGFMDMAQVVDFLLLMITYHSPLPYLADKARAFVQTTKNFKWDELNEHKKWDVNRRIQEKRRNQINLRA